MSYKTKIIHTVNNRGMSIEIHKYKGEKMLAFKVAYDGDKKFPILGTGWMGYLEDAMKEAHDWIAKKGYTRDHDKSNYRK